MHARETQGGGGGSSASANQETASAANAGGAPKAKATTPPRAKAAKLTPKQLKICAQFGAYAEKAMRQHLQAIEVGLRGGANQGTVTASAEIKATPSGEIVATHKGKGSVPIATEKHPLGFNAQGQLELL